MIGGTLQRDVRLDQAVKGVSQGGSIRVEDGGMEEPGAVAGRGRSVQAFPGIEADVVMVAACGEEGRRIPEALHFLKTEHVSVESQRSLQIGHLEMDVPDADLRMDSGSVHVKTLGRRPPVGQCRPAMVGMFWQHGWHLKHRSDLEWHFLSCRSDWCYVRDAMIDPDTPPSVPDPFVPPNPPVPPPPAVASGVSSDERTWAMFGHLSALTGLLTGGIGYIVGPLIIWQVKKDTMPFAAEQSKEALNFNISWLLWGLLLAAVTVPLIFLLVGFLLLPVLVVYPVVWAIFSIVAGLRANEGQPYRYPLTVRFIH